MKSRIADEKCVSYEAPHDNESPRARMGRSQPVAGYLTMMNDSGLFTD